MYNIIRESITSPKSLIKYHSKKGWFVFLYMLIFTLLLSLDIFILLFASENPTVNNETTSCEIVSGSLICGETAIEDQNFSAYGVPIYFLSESQELSDVTDNDYVIIVKDDMAFYRFGSTGLYALELSTFESVGELYSFMKTTILVPLIIATIIQNFLIIIFIVLISTLPFLRFRKEIRYRKTFKLVTFASTPIFIILTINNLMNFDMIIFFVLMFIGYRSIFVLQKELYIRSMMRQQRQHYHQKQEDSIEDMQPEDIIDQEEDEEK